MGTLTTIQSRYNREKISPLPPIPEHTSCVWSVNAPHQYTKDKRKRTVVRNHHDHSLVNLDRQKHGLLPLRRSKFLENLAASQAKSMAAKCHVQHSAKTIQELQEILQSKSVGENVQSGSSVAAMHAVMSPVLLQNVLGDFHEYGVATAKGADDKLYMCQMFRSVR